jgi:sec-independent protein translocase protein TatA
MELGIGEIVVILVVVLIFFGPTKLPQLGEALGRGIRNFKKAASEPEPLRSAAPEAASPSLLEAAELQTTPATHVAREPATRAGVRELTAVSSRTARIPRRRRLQRRCADTRVRARHTQVALDRPLDVAFARQHGFDRLARRERDLVEHGQVQGISHRDDERSPARGPEGHREDLPEPN